MDKTMHDIFHLGSSVVLNGLQYKLDEVMILGTPENQYTVLKFYRDNNKFAIYGVDIETNKLSTLSLEQADLYEKALQHHKKRLINGNVDKILNYKDDSVSYEYKDILKKIFSQNSINTCSSKLSIGDTDYKFDWFSFLYNKKGSTLVVTIPVLEMAECLSKKPLYEDVLFSTSLLDDILKYSGNVVRVEKSTAAYILYIHPYSMEIMQATQCSNTTFENISNPFAVMDFIINHSNSDITGIVYPDSNNKHIHEYIVAGILKNIDIDIENCVIGKVRIGKQIDVSESFESSISNLSEEHTTFAWVSLKSDSLYNAFYEGKKLLIVATEFLAFMAKNDMCADWFGTVDIGNNVWDVRSHYPKITLGNLFYIENCILGESITLTDKNMLLPNAIKLDENAEYLFDYDWVENFSVNYKPKMKKFFDCNMQ